MNRDYNKKVSINGELFYDVKTFAVLTNRSTQSVYRLISEGNSVRRIKCIRFFGKPLIPVDELKEFPFCSSGPWAKKNTYTFRELAEEMEAEDAKAKADVQDSGRGDESTKAFRGEE